MKNYEVKLEISGPTAMWTRPDTGDAPISYPVPTFAASKGIFESILFSQWAEIRPTKVEICSPIVYHHYHTNYTGPLRKAKIIPHGTFQLLATVLVDVCYRLYAVPMSSPQGYDMHGNLGRQKKGTTNGAHAYQAIFNRRLQRGRCYYTPFLGWKEFVPNYVGPFRSKTTVCEDLNFTITSMLYTCFPEGQSSAWCPQFLQKAKVEKGVLSYAQ